MMIYKVFDAAPPVNRVRLVSLFRLLTFMTLCCTLFISKSTASALDIDSSISTDSRIKTFIYSHNEVFPVVLHYGYQTSIEFGKDETVQNYSVGNSYAWQLSIVDNSMFIKPLEENVMTNMTVMTNKRKYYFELLSKSLVNAVDEEIAYAIRFFYHDADENKLRKKSQPILISKEDEEDRIVPYNFKYKISGGSSISPTVVFDDGIKTYLQYDRLPTKDFTLTCRVGKKTSNLKALQYGSTFSINGLCDRIVLKRGRDKAEIDAISKDF